MRVLMVSLLFSPDGVSTAALMTELAVELERAGHDVTVITTTPHYNFEAEARARQPLERTWGGLLYRSRMGGMHVLHAKVAEKGARVLSRALDYLRFHVIGTLAALRHAGRYDVVFAPTPPPTIGVHAWLLARARNARFIYNVQEIYPDVALRLGVLKPGRIARLLERMERGTYRRADAVVVISEWFRRRLLEKDVDAGKLHVIPNFVDTEFVRPLPRHNALSAELDLDGRFVVLYSGNLGLTQDFESVLDAAERLADLDDVRFVIVGNGARRDWLECELAGRCLRNVQLLPYQPRSRIPELYASCDVGIIPMKPDAAHDTFPSKVYTIMASGRAVLATAEPDTELAWLTGAARAGVVVPPERPDALAAAIRDLHGDRDAVRSLGERGREYVVSKHSGSAVCAQYDALIRAVGARG